jgi:hypothetical protein
MLLLPEERIQAFRREGQGRRILKKGAMAFRENAGIDAIFGIYWN